MAIGQISHDTQRLSGTNKSLRISVDLEANGHNVCVSVCSIIKIRLLI